MRDSPYLLDESDFEGCTQILKERKILDNFEHILKLSKAGDGNMNLTLRIDTNKRSFILKQARSWVEKYPQIAAPSERSLVETAFYEYIQTQSVLKAIMPKLIGNDQKSRILVIEDLENSTDLTSLYSGDYLSESEVATLISFLRILHQPLTDHDKEIFRNRQMRALNHEHMFRLPLEPDNGIELDSVTNGLQKTADSLKKDRVYVEKIVELGEIYLADGCSLVHGDFFPGSWLRTPNGIRIIDPEFCFMGAASFDLGIMLAHLFMSNQPDGILRYARSAYSVNTPTLTLANGFAGVEIMRRLIGVAQLPLDVPISKKRELLDLSYHLVLGI